MTGVAAPTSPVGWLAACCFGYLVLTYLRYGLLIAASAFERTARSGIRRPGEDDLVRESPLTIPVTIIAPLFNEAPIAVASVGSFLAVDYPEFDVVVVNDGSTDDTLERLVEAYAHLRKQGLDARLVMVGKKDWQSEQLLEKIKQLGLQDCVIFPGFVPSDDLPFFYNAAELFVFPSFFEGFGLPVVESMASGLPTITSFGSSLQEVAGDGALLIDPHDTGSIADALCKVLGDAAYRKDLTSRGLTRSMQFKSGNLAEKALEVYKSLA